MAMERLDKLLASTGHWSRKEVKDMIRQGRVRVDGQAARRGEDKADPQQAEILVDGQPVDCGGLVYLMLHKPAGLLSATRDGRQGTVLDLLPDHLRRRGLFPVGRLDKDTEGLLLLTDDGPLAHDLLSPKKHVDKVYYARVDGIVDGADVAALAQGMTLGDGLVCLPAGLEPLEGGQGLSGYPAGGEVPPGQTDAGRQRQAGDLPQAAVHGRTAPGREPCSRPVASPDGGRGSVSPKREKIKYNFLVVFHKKIALPPCQTWGETVIM